MCGIVGYIGEQEAAPLLLDGLRRLEYRGYDSSGIAVISDGKLEIRRSLGKLRNLEEVLKRNSIDGKVGVGHNRWATHGRPSEMNAHPHKAGKIVVVHNGIIENYLGLKEILIKEGHTFKSETDTEVISHLIQRYIFEGKNFEKAVKASLKAVKGSYAIGVLSEDEPGKLIAARNESPLVIGMGQGEFFIASDVPAILSQTRNMIFLDDGEMAILSRSGVRVTDLKGKEVIKEVTKIDWNPALAEKGGYKHFMLKEIFEQPQAIINTFRGRILKEEGEVFWEENSLSSEELKEIKKIVIIACGTSWHAALVGKFMIEGFCRIPVEVDLGSEYRYRNPILDKRTLLVLISQSGETADTLAALKEGVTRGAKTISICNVVGSSMVRNSDGVIYTYAGPEIGVASTKAFTAQLVALYLLTLHLGNIFGRIASRESEKMTQDLIKLPHQIEEILREESTIEEVARKYMKFNNFLYLGRGINYPIALEGALKLKEISYIHAEGYPAGEMKHGPIALIDEEMPVVVLISKGKTYEKVMGNIEEVRARKGKVIAIASKSDEKIREKADTVISIPENNPALTPILLTIPLQLLAYYIGVLKGTDVDQPRNLAKSVTVE
jgi:glucosamine--fructose-6-phosphate aminotransferase (isomerizing)